MVTDKRNILHQRAHASGNTHRHESSALAGRVLFARHEVYLDAQRVDQDLLPQRRLEESVARCVHLLAARQQAFRNISLGVYVLRAAVDHAQKEAPARAEPWRSGEASECWHRQGAQQVQIVTSKESSGNTETIDVKTALRRSATDSMMARRICARLVRSVIPVNVPVVGMRPCCEDGPRMHVVSAKEARGATQVSHCLFQGSLHK